MIYKKQLLHPSWLNFRSQLIYDRGNKCEVCEAETFDLDVHHGYYEPGKLAWQYNPETLWLLCRKCHEEIQDDLTVLHRMISTSNPKHLRMATKYIKAWKKEYDNELLF